ncbi:MAG: glycosyltransferase [Anaerolineaceae bacterium]|nr:glycosyltransferase [Anaerolineaceae bacterium]
MRSVFVTNFCSHYRIKTFESLSKTLNTEFYFYSGGNEWYWQKQHGVNTGQFKYHYLPSFQIGKTKILLSLIPALINNHYDVYIKCVNGKFALLATFLVARLTRKPFILWLGIWMRLQTPLHRLIFPLTRWVYNHADAVVVYGEHVKRYLLTEGVPAERIFVTTHAVDNDLYNQPVPLEKKASLRQKLVIPEDQKIVLFLGRLETIKGLPYLLEAFALLDRKDTCLVIAGEGSERGPLEQQATRLGIGDRVRFSGYVNNAAALLFYACSSVFVLPSITTPQGKETWGLVVNEAFNQGLPVIATDAVGAAAGGLVEDGVNGFIVPERDSRALAGALQKLLDDPDLRQRMGANARQKIAHWDNEHMVAGFARAVEYVLKK